MAPGQPESRGPAGRRDDDAGVEDAVDDAIDFFSAGDVARPGDEGSVRFPPDEVKDDHQPEANESSGRDPA